MQSSAQITIDDKTVSIDQLINDSLLQKNNLEIARHFFSWVKENLLQCRVEINTTDANIHVVDDGVFLIAPKIFEEYLLMKGIDTNMHSRLAKRFANLRLNVLRVVNRNQAMNLHRYYLKKHNGKKLPLDGYLIAFNHFYADKKTIPHVNPALMKNDFNNVI